MTEPTGPGWAPKKPPPQGNGDEAPKPKRFWWRFVLASVLIVAVSAATTAAATLLYLDSIANAIQPKNDKLQKRLNKFLADAGDGGAQTFLVIGSDKRANEAEDPGRSDTTMLVRLDPDKGLISMMSIPRDLKVEIPGYGTGKFNEAYAYGGTKLTLQTVKDLTDLPINHVVNVDFLGFAQGVYAIGCVYVDIDRRYYHSNVESAEQYAEINVQPGYQLMCGKQALDYVRYRHTDTDIVRSARQQEFLSAARSRISVQDLVFDQGELVEAFTDYTTSDISDGKTLLEVLKLLGASRNATINEVNFPAELSPSFVYTTPSAVEAAVREFLGGETTQEAKAAQRQSREEVEAGKKKHEKQKPKRKQKPKKPKVEVAKPGTDGLVPAREAGEVEAEIAARRARGFFPIYYPTRLPEGTRFVESNPYEKVVDPYVYNIRDEDENRHVAYRMVLVAEMSDGTHYFGVQGIRGWSDPPILDDPSLTKTIHGRDYDIYVDGENVKMVAWHRGENVYWISNDLLRTLTNDQMIGMARSAKVLVPTKRKQQPKSGRSRG
jgi:polyisoprenyl-teichoic acid--peptidoglycan teichoic acid transferase